MSDTGVSNVSLFQDPQAAAILRQQKMAEMLQQQALSPIEVQSYKGIQAPISPLNVLAKVLQGYWGHQDLQSAQDEATKLQQGRNEEVAKAIPNMYTMPAQQNVNSDGIVGGPATQFGDIAPATAARPRTAAEYGQEAGTLMASPNPQMRALAPSMLAEQKHEMELEKNQALIKAMMGNGAPGAAPNPALALAAAGGDLKSAVGILTPAKMNAIQQAQEAERIKLGLSPQEFAARGEREKFLGTMDLREKLAKDNVANRVYIQTGTGIDKNDPQVQSYVGQMLKGNITGGQIPLKYRTAAMQAADEAGPDAYSPLARTRLATAASKVTAPYIKLPAYQLYASSQPYLQRMNAAAGMRSSVGDTDLLDSLVKLETGGNQVTEAQVATTVNGQSIVDKVNVFKNKIAGQGGVLSDQQRKEALALGNQIFSNYKKGYEPVYADASQKLEGIPKQFWPLPDLNRIGEASGLNSAPAAGGASLPDPLGLRK